MIRHLLDVNVLIALIDPSHVRHDDAHAWFAAVGKHAWATCPFTQNGVVRIVGSNRYPNSPGTPAVVVPLMRQLTQLPGHAFWPDDLSLLDHKYMHAPHLSHSSQVSDSYLLALAVAHRGKLATFDHALVTDAVHQGRQALYLIGPV